MFRRRARGMEMTMAIADWIREATERRRQRILKEAYDMGYDDADKGRPRRPLSSRTNPDDGDNGASK